MSETGFEPEISSLKHFRSIQKITSHVNHMNYLPIRIVIRTRIDQLVGHRDA